MTLIKLNKDYNRYLKIKLYYIILVLKNILDTCNNNFKMQKVQYIYVLTNNNNWTTLLNET